MSQAFLCDAIRTPIGRYGGALAAVRTDDLGALPIAELIRRNPALDWSALDDVIYGCANQAGEDNRNVARMATLLAGLPETVSATTVNRLCGSGLDALGIAARAIRAGEANLVLAGGVESMSRAPFVLGKAERAFARQMELQDTTLGWRFINPRMRDRYGVDSMAQTADNVAAQFAVSRADQDAFALRSQQRYARANASGRFADEIVPLEIPQAGAAPLLIDSDEHPRPQTRIDDLARLKAINGPQSTVTAGNASGINDGACALLVASESALDRHALQPRARVLGMATVGVAPRLMGIGPAPAIENLLTRLGLSLSDIDIIELNEAFAAQALAVTRRLGLADDDPRVNPQGGAIAVGHPLGMSGARLALTATAQLQRGGGRYALCSMCIGVGQGIAMLLEAV